MNLNFIALPQNHVRAVTRSPLQLVIGRLNSWWAGLRGISRRAPRRLRLAESLALGERRFVAVVEFEQSRFLLGGTANSLVLLARLNERETHAQPGGAVTSTAGEELS